MDFVPEFYAVEMEGVLAFSNLYLAGILAVGARLAQLLLADGAVIKIETVGPKGDPVPFQNFNIKTLIVDFHYNKRCY